MNSFISLTEILKSGSVSEKERKSQAHFCTFFLAAGFLTELVGNAIEPRGLGLPERTTTLIRIQQAPIGAPIEPPAPSAGAQKSLEAN